MNEGTTSALPPALAAERRERHGPAGRISYYVAGEGPPMLLLHSINAAGSAYEVRPIFERARETHRVYAIDLPGFGFSERSARRYDVGLYVLAVADALAMLAEAHGPVPVDVLALSLSAEFAARATSAAPDRIRSLALVTPTGFNRRAASAVGEPGTTREIPLMRRILGTLGIGRGLFALLTTRASIAYFLRRTWVSDAIDGGLLDYDVAVTHQPGAHHAPLAFLSGALFSADIGAVYRALGCPVWVPHGSRGDFSDFSGAEWARERGNWSFERFATGALPHFEQPEAFMRSFRAFLARNAASN